MTWSIRKMVVVGICVFMALFFASPIQGKDKVKLTEVEVDKLLLKPGAINFGINHQTNLVYIIEALENGNRSVYWRSLANPMVWGTDIGTLKIVGDQGCSKWSWGAPERCFDMYRIGENKYELWQAGSIYATWYKPQIDYETKKNKVKLTEADLNELESEYGVYLGVNQITKNVWIMIRPSRDKRELYWRSTTKPGLSMSWTGTARIVGDSQCFKWTFGGEKCFEIYKVGEDKYESWYGGTIDSVYYQLK